VNDPAWYQPFLDAVGWVPAVVFPVASVLQLMTLLRRGKADGVSVLTWSLFAVANVCLYLTVAEWTRPQVIVTTLGTAAVQVVVVMTALRLRADKAAKHPDSAPKA
jgi:fatty acid desaturase